MITWMTVTAECHLLCEWLGTSALWTAQILSPKMQFFCLLTCSFILYCLMWICVKLIAFLCPFDLEWKPLVIPSFHSFIFRQCQILFIHILFQNKSTIDFLVRKKNYYHAHVNIEAYKIRWENKFHRLAFKYLIIQLCQTSVWQRPRRRICATASLLKIWAFSFRSRWSK